MDKKRSLKKSLVTALEVPADLAYKDPIVTITGNNCMAVENYRSILRYTKDEIIILTVRGRVEIHGKQLCIPCYSPWEMQVSGKILNVCLDWQEA